jgi:hypothetical protein
MEKSMTAPQRPRRRGHAADRLLNPTLSAADIACDYALAPFDRAARDADNRWGIDRLPELVSTETAAKWGKTLASLNDAIETSDPESVRAWAEVGIRGLAVMDAEAEKRGAIPADPAIWEYEYNGLKFGIFADGAKWQAAKRKRPDLVLYSMQEVAAALVARMEELPAVAAALAAFPEAQITAVNRTPATIADDSLEDFL